MSELPALLAETVDDDIVERVDLGGDDVVVVTTGETHVYRSEGLLSDESVDTFSHDVDSLAIETGRRKTVVRFVGHTDERSFKLPAATSETVTDAILEGILRTKEIIESTESCRSMFRFSDLTFVITDQRLLKHVGGAIYADDFETVRYDEISSLDFEEGAVATQVVVQANGRSHRVKVPNEHARRVRQAVEAAVFDFYNVDSLAELRTKITPSDDEGAARSAEVTTTGPLEAPDEFTRSGDEESADQTFEFPESPQSITTEDTPTPDLSAAPSNEIQLKDVVTKLDALNTKLEEQAALLESQQATIDQLVDELRRGR